MQSRDNSRERADFANGEDVEGSDCQEDPAAFGARVTNEHKYLKGVSGVRFGFTFDDFSKKDKLLSKGHENSRLK